LTSVPPLFASVGGMTFVAVVSEDAAGNVRIVRSTAPRLLGLAANYFEREGAREPEAVTPTEPRPERGLRVLP
jgi:hypothetical protein